MEFNATFIVSGISFILFTLIMNWIFYKPMTNIVAQRKKFLEEHYKEAADAKEKSDAILRDKAQKLEKSKDDARKLISQKTDEVKAQKAEVVSQAQQKAQGEISVAKDELYRSKDEAQEALSNQVVELAQNISSKILGEDIAIANVDKDMINKLMQESK